MSTANDMARWMYMLLNDGIVNGTRVVDPDVITATWSQANVDHNNDDSMVQRPRYHNFVSPQSIDINWIIKLHSMLFLESYFSSKSVKMAALCQLHISALTINTWGPVFYVSVCTIMIPLIYLCDSKCTVHKTQLFISVPLLLISTVTMDLVGELVHTG